MLRVTVIVLLFVVVNANANDYWKSRNWRDDFTMGLWKGCIDKTIVLSGYFEEFGNITLEDLTNPKDSYLKEIKRACDCQTKYFEDNYTTERLKSILSQKEGKLAYSSLIDKVAEKCL